MEGKDQFYCRAVCNAQKMPVRLFYFFVVFLSLFILSSLHRRDRGTFIMLYHQGNDSSTR